MKHLIETAQDAQAAFWADDAHRMGRGAFQAHPAELDAEWRRFIAELVATGLISSITARRLHSVKYP